MVDGKQHVQSSNEEKGYKSQVGLKIILSLEGMVKEITKVY